MKILLVCTAYNSLTQRVHVELDERGHEISVEFALNEAVVCEAVALFQPDLILAPMLKTPIAEEVWRNYRCIIIHPGPKGDRGPSSLDWAVSLRVIEAAPDPAAESWANINAMDDLVYEILTTETHLVISALQGNAGAGGVMLAIAADEVVARKSVILNPHYKALGNLYGSEYWTYSLPRRVGAAKAMEFTNSCLPLGTKKALETGLIDHAFGDSLEQYCDLLQSFAESTARSPNADRRLVEKKERRARENLIKTLVRPISSRGTSTHVDKFLWS